MYPTNYQPYADNYQQYPVNYQQYPVNYQPYLVNYQQDLYNPYAVQSQPVQYRRRRRRFDSPEDIARLLIPFIFPYYYSPYPPYYYPPSPYYPPYDPYYYGYRPVMADAEGEDEAESV